MKPKYNIDMLSQLLEYNSQMNLTDRISKIELELIDKDKCQVNSLIEKHNYSKDFLEGALQVKSIAGQINVLIHYYGIIMTLPYILEEHEIIEEVSLGAGNTGKNFDLTTNKRIAEFKFIHWKGHDTIRQNNLFKDYFFLAEEMTDKQKCLYVINKTYPVKFLNGKRSLNSVLSKNIALRNKMVNKYGNKYNTVSDYYNQNKDKVEIVDLCRIAPSIWE